jgi:hypothetical protein
MANRQNSAAGLILPEFFTLRKNVCQEGVDAGEGYSFLSISGYTPYLFSLCNAI